MVRWEFAPAWHGSRQPASHPRKPRSAQCAVPPPQPSAAHLIWHSSQRVADLLLSVHPSVRPSVCLYALFVSSDRPHVCMRLHVRGARAIPVWRPGHGRTYMCASAAYLHRYVRIITYKRVILSYTPALLMIIKTPRSILFALEYFLKFSPDNGAIRAYPASSLHHPPVAFPLPSPVKRGSSGYTLEQEEGVYINMKIARLFGLADRTSVP